MKITVFINASLIEKFYTNKSRDTIKVYYRSEKVMTKKKLYSNFLRINIETFLETRKFYLLLIEFDLENLFEKWINENTVPESQELIDYGAVPFTINYDKVLWDLLNNIYGSKIYKTFIENFLIEFFVWKDFQVETTRLEDILKEIFESIRSSSLILKLNSLNEIPIIKESEKIEENVEVDQKKDKVQNDNIFIVHGHDEVARLKLKDFFLNDLKLNPIILQDKQNDSLSSILSKFENLAQNCSAAIVLFTPDDIGDKGFRARQNVILELGYFLGKFGNENDRNIIIIKKGDIEIPSDINGVIYEQYQTDIKETFYNLTKQFSHWKYNIK